MWPNFQRPSQALQNPTLLLTCPLLSIGSCEVGEISFPFFFLSFFFQVMGHAILPYPSGTGTWKVEEVLSFPGSPNC